MRLQASLGAVPPCTPLLGRDERGAPLLAYLPAPEVSHILIAGAGSSGKTALVRAIISSLALANGPDDLRILLIAANGSEMAQFQGLPHLIAPPVHNPTDSERWLHWLVDEMAWREQSGVRAPHVVLAVDDVDDLLARSPGVEDHLASLAAHGRPVGIHLVLSTRDATDPAVQALLPNLPCRLVGRVASWRDAIAAAGIKQTGAEKLASRGDFVLAAGGEMVRFRAGLITPAEIAVMVEMIQDESFGGRARVRTKRETPVVPFARRWGRRVAQLVGGVTG